MWCILEQTAKMTGSNSLHMTQPRAERLHYHSALLPRPAAVEQKRITFIGCKEPHLSAVLSVWFVENYYYNTTTVVVRYYQHY